jgi:MFS family permease
MTAAVRRSFSSLAIPNYRRYFSGQSISVAGTWMQWVAEAWLVLKLTGSGTAVGVSTGLQFFGLLVFGAYGGVLADRYDKRKILMTTQPLMALLALLLFVLTATHVVTVAMVFGTVLLRGCVTAFDNPARQSFVSELVGSAQVVNAVSLNSVMVSSARIVGPALAAVVIATLGVAPCFLFNAATFVVMLFVLSRLDVSQLHRSARAARAKGQIRQALSIVRSRSELWVPLSMMAVVGTFAYNFPVLLPLFAKFVWHGNATTYAVLTGTMALGSVFGGLVSAHRGRVSPKLLVAASAGFGTFILLTAAAPTEQVQLLLLLPTGVMSMTFMAACNSSLQLAAEGPLRGRVMALFGIVFLGSTPIGAPIVGWVSEVASPRWGMAIGGIAALATAAGAAYAFRATRHLRDKPAEAPAQVAEPVGV